MLGVAIISRSQGYALHAMSPPLPPSIQIKFTCSSAVAAVVLGRLTKNGKEGVAVGRLEARLLVDRCSCPRSFVSNRKEEDCAIKSVPTSYDENLYICSASLFRPAGSDLSDSNQDIYALGGEVGPTYVRRDGSNLAPLFVVWCIRPWPPSRYLVCVNGCGRCTLICHVEDCFMLTGGNSESRSLQTPMFNFVR